MRGSAARVAIVVSVTLAACASAGHERYQEVRERLSHAQTDGAPRVEQDPFAGAPTLSRAALVSSVLERNPGLEAARATWRAELARYPQETALEDPMLGYTARPSSFASSSVDPGNDVVLSQAFPFPGKLALRGERALAGADAAQGELESERLEIAALASELFDQYWVADRALETNAQHLALLDEATGVALSRYAAGTGPQQDVLAAETERAMLRQREVELAAERRIVIARVNTLLHRPPELALPAPPRELEPVAAQELDEPALVARALQERPELRALAARVRGGEAALALARREFLPDFTLRAGYETSWQEDPLKPMVGVEINLPLQLERRRAAVEEAEARLARERSRLRQLEDRVRFEVASAVERLRETQHLLEISQRLRLPPARDRVVGARATYSSGRTSFLELVDAERSLRTAEQAEFEARASLSIRRAALARALGELPGAGEPRL